jgi:hypothetical protein
MSSKEVHYMTTSQAMWFSTLFGNIGVSQMKPIVIYDDNQSCISLLKNLVFHAHAEHIKIHHHLVWKKIEKSFIKLVYCNAKNMIVDILTNGLSIDKDEYFWHLMNLIKWVTWKFVEWGCWKSTSYQVS